MSVPPGDAEPALPPYDGRKESTAGGGQGRGEDEVTKNTGVSSGQDTSTKIGPESGGDEERRLRPTRRERVAAKTGPDGRQLRQLRQEPRRADGVGSVRWLWITNLAGVAGRNRGRRRPQTCRGGQQGRREKQRDILRSR
jgi:hypothetical protein